MTSRVQTSDKGEHVAVVVRRKPFENRETTLEKKTGAVWVIVTGCERGGPSVGCTIRDAIPGEAPRGIAAWRKSGPARVIGTGSVRPAASRMDSRTPARTRTGVGEDSVTLVRLNVSMRNRLPAATVPRARLVPLRAAFGSRAGGPKSKAAGAAKLPALV